MIRVFPITLNCLKNYQDLLTGTKKKTPQHNNEAFSFQIKYTFNYFKTTVL